MSWYIKLYWAVGIFLIIGALLVRYFIILPFLQRRGKIGIGSWLFNFKHYQNLEIYGEICLAEEKSLFWYKALRLTQYLVIAWLLGWLFLMLFHKL